MNKIEFKKAEILVIKIEEDDIISTSVYLGANADADINTTGVNPFGL